MAGSKIALLWGRAGGLAAWGGLSAGLRASAMLGMLRERRPAKEGVGSCTLTVFQVSGGGGRAVVSKIAVNLNALTSQMPLL